MVPGGWNALSTAHESKSTGKGSKQTLSTIYGDVEIEINVRGYKSSEGDSVFPDPHGLEAPHNLEEDDETAKAT
jgi:hypothetical protein